MHIELPYNYTPREYQIPAWTYMQDNRSGLRACCVWHRRAGKDLMCVNLATCKSQERVGTYWHVLPTYKQGRAIVWNGVTAEEKPFLSHIPREICKGFNSTEMRVDFINGSFYQVVGSDDVNRLVGTNPVGVVMSEYSLQDPSAWDYIRPILAENGGWAIFIFTPRGKNHGWDLYETAMQNSLQNGGDWFCEKLVAGDNGTRRHDDTPVVSDAMIQKEREDGMPEETIQQEFFTSFESPLVGAYYSTEMTRAINEGRITNVPHENELPVDTWWDLGVDDSTSIVFTQDLGTEIRIIDYYENSGEGVEHYIAHISGQTHESRHRAHYTYRLHTAPHDIKVREWTGKGKTRWQICAELGLKFRMAPKHEIMDGIQKVRSILSRCVFDKRRTERLVKALKEYTKDWDEINMCFANRPKHSWASHGADAFRIMAMGKLQRPKYGQANAPIIKTLDNYQYI
jgi:phage terminase large subunit